MSHDFVQNEKHFFSTKYKMTELDRSIKILNKPKQTIQELSRTYKILKNEGLNIKWIDVLRKSSRGQVKDKVQGKVMKIQRKAMKRTEKVIESEEKEINEMIEKSRWLNQTKKKRKRGYLQNSSKQLENQNQLIKNMLL